jgi:AAA15 family ATPase/GTPase
MDELINAKLIEAQKILKELGLPDAQQNKICALTLLALADEKPNDKWQYISKASMTLTKNIMEFVNKYYNAGYAANSRESFRKLALRPFVDYNIAVHNPDNPNLSPTSAKNHYALSDLAFNALKKYNTNEWNTVAENFRKYQSQLIQRSDTTPLVRKLKINNFKSIVNTSIELGRFNVFIGANGSGKSNLLEVMACIGAAKVNDLSLDGLNSRGVRYARPDLMLSSFADQSQNSEIDVALTFEEDNTINDLQVTLSPVNKTDPYTKWVDLAEENSIPETLMDFFVRIRADDPEVSDSELMRRVNSLIRTEGINKTSAYNAVLSDYAIYDINTATLRGLARGESNKTPLGINGEGLDLLVANLTKEEKKEIYNCQKYFDWLGEIITDKKEDLPLKGLKPGRSKSNLYFTDNFMDKSNNIFSAENSNEGILHVLFYLNLFISKKTPRIFAIDNIETALNPRLCRVLIKELARLSEVNGKQVLITTHNPAVLDGLNLLDNEQRLFEVSRNSKGYTRAERIKFKSNLEDKPYRLSEMWVKGLLGGVPLNF